MKTTNKEILEYVEPKLKEKFGKHTCLAKHPLSPEKKAYCKSKFSSNPVWSIITLGDQALDYTIHGCGCNVEEALQTVGMKGCVEDLKALKRDDE